MESILIFSIDFPVKIIHYQDYFCLVRRDNRDMRLLTYTKYLWRKIKFYDKLAFKTNSFLQNPFEDKEKSITVVWIDDGDNNIFYKL